MIKRQSTAKPLKFKRKPSRELRVMDIYFMSLTKEQIIKKQRAIIVGLEKIIDDLQQTIQEFEERNK